MNSLTRAVLLALPLLFGCIKQKSEAPAAAPTPFAVDAFDDLRRSCATGQLEGCDTVKALSMKEASLRELHRQQVAEQRALIRQILTVLEGDDQPPVTRVTAVPLDPDSWPDDSAVVTGTLEVRSSIPRGFESIGNNTKASFDSLMSKLDKMITAHEDAFKERMSSSPTTFVLPEDFAAERKPLSMVAKTADGTTALRVLSAAAEDLEFERSKPWAAVASFVITEDGLPYKAIDSHRIVMEDAVKVKVIDAGIFIEERTASIVKYEKTSEIPVTAVCETLRGELRFLRTNEALRLQASFVDADSAAGGAQ